MEKSSNSSNLAQSGSEGLFCPSDGPEFRVEWRKFRVGRLTTCAPTPAGHTSCAETSPQTVQRLRAGVEQAESLRWESHQAGRYYEATVQQDLFGGWEVWKRWGSIGQARGGQQCLPVRDQAQGLAELGATARRRRSRGYAVVRACQPGPVWQPLSDDQTGWPGPGAND